MKSYNLNISQNRAVRTDSDCHGWCYGLPPGISSAQWPLDPANGYPLQHGFTLLLPEEYRCHGPDFVAFSFFASSIDHNDGGPTVKAPGIRPAMGGAEAPDNPELKLFWEAEQRAHPHLSRMEDSLGIAYAVIMLIRAEFDGPFCAPPILVANRYRDALKPPAWLTIGGAASYWQFGSSCRWVRDIFGEKPANDPIENRAIHWTPRACDPNAGRIPYDEFLHDPTDYVHPVCTITEENGKTVFHDPEWIRGHEPNHIGGTMRPSQWVTRVSLYYIEFEEYFGGFNFGGGNAQLDFRDMIFDWSCG